MGVTDLLPSAAARTGTGDPTHAVIWLHGLGADGFDFVPIVPDLGLGDLAVQFVFPHAPEIPVSLNNGYVMPAWYDIRDTDLAHRHDETGIRVTAKRIDALIDAQVEAGIPAHRIALAGFSQGGAIALHNGLRYPQRLAGVIALSTYLVLEPTLATERSEANLDVPIFAAHGTVDPVVVPLRGITARDQLQSMGYEVEWHEYHMPHSVCVEEIAAIGGFLRRVLV